MQTRHKTSAAAARLLLLLLAAATAAAIVAAATATLDSIFPLKTYNIEMMRPLLI